MYDILFISFILTFSRRDPWTILRLVQKYRTYTDIQHCVRRRTSIHERGRTAPYVRQHASMYGDVRHHTSTQDTADAKLYATYCCCQWTQLRCRIRRRTATQRNMPQARFVRHVVSVAGLSKKAVKKPMVFRFLTKKL